MTHVSTSEIREKLAKVVDRVARKRERVVVQRRGKDLIALVSLEDLALLEAIEERQDEEDARVALAEADEKGTKPLATFMAEREISR